MKDFDIKEYSILTLSSKSEDDMDTQIGDLIEYFKKNKTKNSLTDLAYRLNLQCKNYRYRKMLVTPSIINTIEELSTSDSRKVKKNQVIFNNIKVVFMFSGLGSQYVNMGRELYSNEDYFQTVMNNCFRILKEITGLDIKNILYPENQIIEPQDMIDDILISQLLIFIIEYTIAKYLIKHGCRPTIVVGYSFGEYTAACIAGVIALKDALSMIVERGHLLSHLSEGGMINIPLEREKVENLIKNELSIAIDNGESCVVSGREEEIEILEKFLKKNNILAMRIKATRALHSMMMNPIKKDIKRLFKNVDLNNPEIPILSGMYGRMIKANEINQASYWSNHIRERVQFYKGICSLAKEPNIVFVEIGPGHDLCSLIIRQVQEEKNQQVIYTLRNQYQKNSDLYIIKNVIGQLWLYGANVNWHDYHRGQDKVASTGGNDGKI